MSQPIVAHRGHAQDAVVVTTISSPNKVLQAIASGCAELDMKFVVIGDTKSPESFSIQGCEYYSVDDQLRLPYKTARLSPTRHYARKNVGYLVAIANGARFILETDDDNLPGPEFFQPLPASNFVPLLRDRGWINVYGYFTDHFIWPRGLPLGNLRDRLAPLPEAEWVETPIQQGLADSNPDVDAVYRLVMDLPFSFTAGTPVAVGPGSWSPFNSQNTVHYRKAFQLLYLPAFCSFRMTDIWRSFVSQRVAMANGWGILFRGPTVVQDRNDHDLLSDFRDEVVGYLRNAEIAEILQELELFGGIDNIASDMRRCYAALVTADVFPEKEIQLLDAWLDDVRTAAVDIFSS